MRRVSFLLLFLVLGSLLAAAPVRAQDTGYIARLYESSYFQGSINVQKGDVTIVALARLESENVTWKWPDIVLLYNSTFPSWENNIRLEYGTEGSTSLSDDRVNLFLANDSAQVGTYVYLYPSEFTLFVASVSISGDDAAALSINVNNGELTSEYSGTLSVAINGWDRIRIGDVDDWGQVVDVVAVYIYNRKLSDSEIQAIYENPLNPPKDGIVAGYTPYSLDTSGVWHDISGNGYDLTAVGTVEYVPIQQVQQFDYSYIQENTNSSGFVTNNFKLFTKGVYTIITISRLSRYEGSDWRFPDVWRMYYGPVWWGPNVRFEYSVRWVNNKEDDAVNLIIGNGSTQRTVSLTIGDSSKWHFFVTVVDFDTLTLKLKVDDGGFVSNSFSDMPVGTQYYNHFEVKGEDGVSQTVDIAYLLVYSRALSNDEIRQIYADPLNPPRDGLVLWYSPYSYDPETGRWLNVAPIFPTIPLAEELDAVNHGAEAVRVSIPRVQAYDATNNSEINIYNLTVKTTDGETFIPWFMPLPYNETLTLNVSAVGYKPSIVSVQAPIDNLVFYLYPSQAVTFWERPELNVNLDNITADEYLPDASKDIDKFSSLFTRWLGGEYFKWLLSLNLEGMLKDFFNNPPIPGLGILLALMIWAGAVLMTWLYFEEPEPVFVEGNIVYFGLMQFIDVSPGILAVPLGVFILFLGYKQLYKALKVWAKR